MPVLTVCNHKGGTGKTTTVMHLAAAMGLGGRRVLVVDLDPQCFLTQMMGVKEPPPDRSSLALLTEGVAISTLPAARVGGFDLLPATQYMTRAQRKLTGPMDSFWIKESLAEGFDYDVVIFDTAAAVSVFTMNALVASEHALIPVTPEYQPVVGAGQTWHTCKLVREKLNPGLADVSLLLTQVDGRKRDHAAYSQYVRTTYPGHVMDAVVRTCASLAESTHDGRTVFDREVISRGYRDYANAADELTRRLGMAAAAGTGDEHVEAERVSNFEPSRTGAEQENMSAARGGGQGVLHSWVPLNRF